MVIGSLYDLFDISVYSAYGIMRGDRGDSLLRAKRKGERKMIEEQQVCIIYGCDGETAWVIDFDCFSAQSAAEMVADQWLTYGLDQDETTITIIEV